MQYVILQLELIEINLPGRKRIDRSVGLVQAIENATDLDAVFSVPSSSVPTSLL